MSCTAGRIVWLSLRAFVERSPPAGAALPRVDIDVGYVADGRPRSARMRIRGPGRYRGHRIELRGSSSLHVDKKFSALEMRSRKLKIRNAARSVCRSRAWILSDARSDRTFAPRAARQRDA